MSSEVETSLSISEKIVPRIQLAEKVVVSASTEIVRDFSASLGMTAGPHLAPRSFLSLTGERKARRAPGGRSGEPSGRRDGGTGITQRQSHITYSTHSRMPTRADSRNK